MSGHIICSVKVNRLSAPLIQSQEYRDQAPVDQEVGGSSPPSCTRPHTGSNNWAQSSPHDARRARDSRNLSALYLNTMLPRGGEATLAILAYQQGIAEH